MFQKENFAHAHIHIYKGFKFVDIYWSYSTYQMNYSIAIKSIICDISKIVELLVSL